MNVKKKNQLNKHNALFVSLFVSFDKIYNNFVEIQWLWFATMTL